MKSLSSTLATLLVLAAPLAIAQSPLQNSAPKRSLQANEHALNLPGATTIEAPAAGFNPLTASDEELQYNGFSPRPDQNANPKAYALWAKAMSRAKTRVEPVLEQTNIFHGPAQIKKNANPTAVESNSLLALQQESNTLYSSNWSGYVDLSGATSYNSSTTFYYTVNEMVVPVAQQSGCTGGWAYGSAWNGIDGWGSGDVLQAGFEFDAYCSGSTRSAYYSTWYEWYPYGEVRVSSVPIVPGDDMFVEVWHTSSTQGYALVENLTTGTYFEVGFTAYPGHPLIGNSAEYIVEAPTVGGSLATMVDYTALPFWDTYAYTEAGAFYDAANGNAVDMEPGSTILSYPQYFGPESFVMHWQ
jgi:Peptidase A4 family